jgi:hypothetical protein
MSVTGRNSHLPDTVIVAIISDDVIIKKVSAASALKIDDSGVLLEISGAFERIQLVVQMLGGYF